MATTNIVRIPHLETDVTTYCQLSCVACNHHVPVWRAAGAWHANAQDVARDLDRLAKVLHAHAWGALGGEPMLNPQLPDILYAARCSGVADRIELWTNGLRVVQILRSDREKDLRFLHECLEQTDDLVLSAYPGKITDEDIHIMRAYCILWNVHLVLKDERNRPNFRTLFESAPTSPEATRTKFNGCFFRQFSRVANAGFFYTCCCAPHMPVLMQGRETGADGVPIDGITVEALQAYLNRSEPLGACAMCAGRDTAQAIPWHEERDPELWRKQSTSS